MRPLLTVLLFVLTINAQFTAFGQVPTYKFTHNYMSPDSVAFKCCFYVPRSYDSTRSYPFLYSWHGAGMEARVMRDLMMRTIAEDIDAIVVAPEFNNVTTNAHLNFLLDTTLNFVRNTYNLDPARSILTGYSAGGRISFGLGLYYPEKWGGIIGFAPAFAHGDMDDTMWANIGEIRMATIIGDQDFNFSYVDAFMKDVPGRGGNLLYILKPGVAHSDPYYGSQAFSDDYRQCYDYVTSAVSVGDIPAASALKLDLYPQPVAGNGSMRYTLQTPSIVTIRLYDALGRMVSEQHRGMESPGTHTLPLSALSVELPAGVYTLVLQAGDTIARKTFLSMR